MNYPELRAELEADRAWREGEIRELQNRGAKLTEAERERFRRALVLLLYAHYEGFCKFAFQLYVNAVNGERLPVSSATDAIAAASISKLILQLSDPQKKTDVFRNELPDDTKLHRFARQREFFQRFREIQNLSVVIPENALDFDSNLKHVVLKKNLYLLGLDENRFDAFEGSISDLLKSRNTIAHGSNKLGIDERTYSRLRTCAMKIMAGILGEISRALQNQDFQKRVPIQLPPGL